MTTAPPTPAPLMPARLSPRAFVARYWHKQPLLMRGALPGFEDIFTWAQLRGLAERDDVESRLVVRDGARWTMTRGPFRRATWRELPARQWTLLVQGINLHDRRADHLMRRFAFLPFARLDDLMVSHAAPGGGVGPHVDSYDVFLLQGAGERRWRYGQQQDLTLKPRLPLKILARFAPSHDHVLARGDILYLPPHVAHDGIALTPCTTYSIGFRAPGTTELAQAFLDYLRDRVDLPGRYADPDLRATSTPARIDPRMQARLASMLARIRVDRRAIADFAGTWLSEPKPDVFFAPPAAPRSRAEFARAAAAHGVALDVRTQLLYDDAAFYINGVALAPSRAARAALVSLANQRALPAARCRLLAASTMTLLHDWYRDGYLDVDR
jgi:50S ribosomal protein L16 3-hydroxylase